MLAALCVLSAGAQTKPNFTGTWKLNQQKSNSSDSITIEFNQKDKDLSEAFASQQGGDVDAKYTLDGKESEVPIGDSAIKATASWEGDALIIDWRGPEEGRYNTRKLTLSADGKILTVNLKHSLPNGGMGELTWVFDKQ